MVQPELNSVDLSSTYHAGSSSDQSGSDTIEEDSDDALPPHRGRRGSTKSLRKDIRDTLRKKRQQMSPMKRALSPVFADYVAEGSRPRRQSFTRSRSPHVPLQSNASAAFNPHVSSASPLSQRRRTLSILHNFYPAAISTQIRLPFFGSLWIFCMDTRHAGESLLLLGSLTFASWKISNITLQPPNATADARKSGSPRTESRDIRRNTILMQSSAKKVHFGFVWMSVPKNYRESPDDGILTGLLLGPLIAAALLYSSLKQTQRTSSSDFDPLPASWRIEFPRVLPNSPSAIESLALSRKCLVDYSTFCSFILLVQVCASWWFEARYRGRRSVSEGERGSVPRSETRRSWYYVLFTFIMTLVALGVRVVLSYVDVRIWQSSLFYQFCLYIAIRLAHGGFTVGELALVCFGGLALGTELLNLTRARIWPITTPFIKTYRLPTPLLIFQIALIAGSFLTGFLLSPLLVLSRHIAQKPVRRLRFPHEKLRQRRALAAGFYAGTVIIVGGLIGGWTWWSLGRRDPWLWAIFWLLEGDKKWSRPVLLAYWGLLGSISVAGWNRQLSRSRRYRPRNTSTGSGDNVIVPVPASQAQNQKVSDNAPIPQSSGALGLAFPNLPNLPNGSQVATDLLDAADKHVPTLGVNARRKFFHALAVVMFLPGVAVDPAFTHLSFSAAFALFIFAEYVRYFAIYPFGAAVHLFMNEFLDHKDSGTAILSHFYLLTGCAGPLWLEGPSQLLQYTGILALGVGDALASIVGKRIGKHRWSPSTSKTLEGSAAFVVSIVTCAWLLRLAGLTEGFSTLRYMVVVVLSSALEALSDQNDNLTLPFFQALSCSVVVLPAFAEFPPAREFSQSGCGVLSQTVPFSMEGCGLTATIPSHLELQRERISCAREVVCLSLAVLGTGYDWVFVASSISRYTIMKTMEEPSQVEKNPDSVSSLSALGFSNMPTVSPFNMPFPRLPQTEEKELRPSRPATASIAEGNPTLLPSTTTVFTMDQGHPSEVRSGNDVPSLIPGQRKYMSLRWESRSSIYMAETASSSFDNITDGSSSSASQSGAGESDLNDSDYDWASFMSAYASGHWHPQRTPNPPRSHTSRPSHSSSLGKDVALPTMSASESSLPSAPVAISNSSSSIPSTVSDTTPSFGPSHAPLPPSAGGDQKTIRPFEEGKVTVENTDPKAPGGALKPPSQSIPFAGRRFRKSFTDLKSASSGKPLYISFEPNQNLGLSPEATTAAATLRWAGARVNLSPLALPSPEHELTDPMRGVHAAIPGSHTLSYSPDTMTPGGLRKMRLGSFWEGTQDVADETDRLSTIPGSNPVTPPRTDFTGTDYFGTTEPEGSERRSLPPPATAPIRRSSPEEPDGDYFSKVPSSEELPIQLNAQGTVTTDISNFWPDLANLRRDTEPIELNVTTVPALPRRICLTRQTSSPLPGSASKDKGIAGSRAVSENLTAFRTSRAAKEEQMFIDLGYLAPPNPPDELERRRALYKYNIWNTGPDVNFDRIVHLVKLVFNTRGVSISLVDSTEHRCPRLTAFSAHTILQRGDEPTVILDTRKDWRFAKNRRQPLVTGSSNVRFYAGAPLRTQDGFNIGSLTLTDDVPRREFSPRQRHTLKEFAAIVMREMELWRDKVSHAPVKAAFILRARLPQIQLRVRDKIQTSMEQFSRECLEIDQKDSGASDMIGTSMDKVYHRAARLVKRTLDVEEVVVMDVSHCEVIETFNAEASVSVVMHNGDSNLHAASRTLTAEEYTKLNTFFSQYPDGKISEGILPVCFRPFIPTHIQYALTVPVFNIDKRPFALICAYNASDTTRRFLEGHELSYLRAIGVIILSAVLKRRMMLADQAKSLFISNISHELRTPLHGILAAAELLSDTSLNHTQASFLHTVQACGTSLVETVNHVLDFTKLSGNMKSGGVENVISRSKVDLEQLVEEAIDGSWIGHCARTSAMRESEIGSVYAPTLDDRTSSVVTAPASSQHVEVVVDIDRREGGWTLKCDKGGIRRVLMNLFGNSLKFTTDGYVHVSLRQLSQPNDNAGSVVKIELCPFSQENPLQAGTGLGLAIVNSIIHSPSVGGKVEVLSEENIGTEIKVIFEAERLNDGSNHLQEPPGFEDPSQPPEISLLGFKLQSKGVQLLHNVLCTYLGSWWGFKVRADGAEMADIVILNEDPSPVIAAIEKMDIRRSFIILSSSRGSPRVMGICNAYENLNGFCRIVHKPGGPYRLRSTLKQLLRAKQRRQHRSSSFLSTSDVTSEDSISLHSSIITDRDNFTNSGRFHRRSTSDWSAYTRSPNNLPLPSPALTGSISPGSEKGFMDGVEYEHPSGQQSMSSSTVTVGSGGTLLKASLGAAESDRHQRTVLVVEDNSILRNLLVVLLDLSMPVLDGVSAAVEIRQIEKASGGQRHSSILALTGMSSLEDKRKAFEAGMDGYLVKPVAFKTLDEMFHKLGLSQPDTDVIRQETGPRTLPAPGDKG
ncbi:hypothetical protein BV22DRAFT_1046735 [Leucogyrophana mollusca]|uniref:Uncharacterized protein n=1 Tax=Leucogyrophana mollusca TaxID=85980 RepID=A0ACB8BKV6_9AGAM|nr:hypothetical protein BV22DRAFT_1046735 [Leucogyrophana mollusca]